MKVGLNDVFYLKTRAIKRGVFGKISFQLFSRHYLNR